MPSTADYWFSPAPSEVTSSRLALDFGLRAADLFFRELVVPELGRVWFVRQLSWPLAALALYEELASLGSNAPKPTAICHGIEALAIYTYPAQMLFCKRAFAGLADLNGRRIRTSSPTQSDWVEALGATPITTPFAELNQSVRTGHVDCAITGSMSGRQGRAPFHGRVSTGSPSGVPSSATATTPRRR